MSTTPASSVLVPSPVVLEGANQPAASRGLWLVKWLLAVPHYVALAFLCLGAVFVWLWALVSIVTTGRYPRGAFDYLLGVLRWSWRVTYYLYDVAATDAYPPFTLADVPDYPARLHVDYPETLSRGLALVKWWLLAVPHYLILAVLFGFSNRTDYTDGRVVRDFNWPGLVPLLVLVALLSVLFSGAYPRRIYDLAMGFNRWRYRVMAYALLMTDVYPPFRLDEGPHEPGRRLSPPAPVPPAASGTWAQPPGPPR